MVEVGGAAPMQLDETLALSMIPRRRTCKSAARFIYGFTAIIDSRHSDSLTRSETIRRVCLAGNGAAAHSRARSDGRKECVESPGRIPRKPIGCRSPKTLLGKPSASPPGRRASRTLPRLRKLLAVRFAKTLFLPSCSSSGFYDRQRIGFWQIGSDGL
jgi:hypothetical protein